MKIGIAFLLLITCFSCNKHDSKLEGRWKVESKFYNSTCHIYKENGFFKGKALSYNDGTMNVKTTEANPYYLFERAKWKKGKYIDGISGASTKEDENPALEIIQKHDDTLEITRYIMKQALPETWVRIK